MTNEQKQLLLKDLCARLPYGVKVTWDRWDDYSVTLTPSIYVELWKENRDINIPKVYLRSMSSMTEEEENEYKALNCYEGLFPRNEDALDYALEHHLDFRGLIPMGLAIEAPEGMYKTD